MDFFANFFKEKAQKFNLWLENSEIDFFLILYFLVYHARNLETRILLLRAKF